MFYCPLHNWYSDEAPCPACHQTITTTLSNSTEQSDTKEEVKEINVSKDEIVGLLRDCVSETWGNKSIDATQELFDQFLEKRKLVTPSMERLNKFITKQVNEVLLDKKYTQSELDEAIQKAEKDAWNFAREKMIIDGKPTERQYRFLSYYEYEIYKKSSEILYQRSLQDNTNTKTSKHWT